MDLLNEFKELYYKEIEFSERLNNKINACITFLTIIGSAELFLWSKLNNYYLNIYSIMYISLTSISLIFFFICLYKFIKTYSGHKVHYMPIKEITIATIKTYEIAGDIPSRKKMADNHVENMFKQRFINDAIFNREVNINKNNAHRKLLVFIAITFICITIAYSSSMLCDHFSIKNQIVQVEVEGGEIDVR